MENGTLDKAEYLPPPGGGNRNPVNTVCRALGLLRARARRADGRVLLICEEHIHLRGREETVRRSAEAGGRARDRA